MSPVLSDLSRVPELYIGLLIFCAIMAILGSDAKSKRAMAVLRLLLRRRP
jgi:hypothetical protein